MLASSIRFYTKAGWARWMHHGSAPSNKPLRGMVDYWGQECEKHRFITETAAEVARSYGYEEIRTPILEDISVFKRSLGDDSDVIGKELYTFVDKNGQEVVMRPEGTAGVTRAMVSENLQYRLPQKLYYAGPMFRHERPQRGRLRQFTQVGIEVFGHAYPSADIECIAVGMKLLQNLGLGDSIELKINSLGNAETRAKYRGELRKYLEDYREELSADSQRRYMHDDQQGRGWKAT
ncbi:hypothetical protein EV182_002113 [Spiromyces aspiralis]|uniref:Uncharacterized protein n=1 Tax=Spiromyces aspiralis TaxID=68401 RepID=A0ACC1HS81_9FUNG|nr:hypothetical protein EV182_002113 [Spiromyces aspiralis]